MVFSDTYQMTYAEDRKPLLRLDSGEGGDIDDLEHFTEMLNPYCTTSNKFYYGKKERYIPKAVLVVMGIFSICFSIDKYQILMKEIESKECNDVLAECNNIPFNQTFVPPFYDYLQDFTISPRYDISLCLIPKVVSTIGTAAICYIQDPEAFTKNNRTISTEMYGGRFCENNELKSFKMVQRSLNSNFDNIIFTRNPYDRFISGFTEKCVNNTDTNICHGCGTDIRCFLQKEYRRLIRMSMLFPVYTGADTHFAPQTWYCDMKNNIKNSTVIQYSSTGTEKIKMIDNLLTVFKNRNVPEENLNEVREELSKGKTQHSTSGTSLRLKYEKLIEEDGAIRRALQRIYYYDFLYLGYSM